MAGFEQTPPPTLVEVEASLRAWKSTTKQQVGAAGYHHTMAGIGGLQTQSLGQQKPGLSLGGLGTGVQLGQAGTGGIGLQLGQAGMGTGLQLGQSGTGTGLQLGQSGTGTGLQLGQTGAGTGLQLGQAGMGTGLQLGQTGAGTGLQLGQTGAGTGLQLGQTGAGTGLQLGQASTGTGLQAGTGGIGLQLGQAGMGTGLQLGQTGTGTGLQLGQAGTGSGLKLGQAGIGAGLQLGQASTASIQTSQTSQSLGTAATTVAGLKLGQTQTTYPSGLTGTSNTTTAPTLRLGAGLPTAASSGSGLGLGLNAGISGLSSSSATTSSGLTTATSAAGVQPAFRGLGGVDPGTVVGRNGSKDGLTSIQDSHVPPVLSQLVDSFQKFMKQQKETSDEISHFSDKAMKKVKHDTIAQAEALGIVSSQVQKDAQVVGFLKQETTEELRNAEIARRTNELPAGLQHENTAPAESLVPQIFNHSQIVSTNFLKNIDEHPRAKLPNPQGTLSREIPLKYFQQMVFLYEAKMQLYRQQIEELESHLSALASDHAISPQNVIEILQLQYKPFLLLAAQLQTIHEQVQFLKEQYLSYRKVFLQDSTDVFEERKEKAKLDAERSQKVKTGPPPFSAMRGQATAALAAFTTSDSSQAPGLMGVGGLGGLQMSLLGGGGGLHQNSLLGGNTQSTGLTLGGGNLGLGGGGIGATGGLGSLGMSGGQGLSLGAVSQPSLVGGSTVSGLNLAGTTQPFNLQKPPLGKRRIA